MDSTGPDAVNLDPETADDARPPMPSQRSAGSRWRRRAHLAGVVLLALGALGLAGTLGWLVRGWVPSGGVGRVTVEVSRPVQVEAEAVSTGSLPNVLGLGLAEARQAYADAGAEPSSIVTRTVANVAQKGTVIAQRPAAASEIPSAGRVELIVARPAHMPQLVGLDADEARKRLGDIGVGATTIVRYDDRVAPGEVAATLPAAGAKAEPSATLIVSEAPSSVNVADLEPLGSGCSLTSAEVDGATVADALVCVVFEEAVTVEYSINDRVSGFEAALALADDAPPGARARLAVSSDDRLAGSFEVAGAARGIRATLPGGHRMVLEVSPIGTAEAPVTVVLSDARIVGARSGIDALVDDSSP